MKYIRLLLFAQILAITVLVPVLASDRPFMPAVKSDACSGSSGRIRELSFRDKIYVVNFWATWCPSCVRFLPSFAELERKHRSADVEFLILTMETRRQIAEFEYNENYEFPFFVGSVPKSYMRELGIESIPTYLVVDKKGRIIWKGHPEKLSSARLETLLKSAR